MNCYAYAVSYSNSRIDPGELSGYRSPHRTADQLIAAARKDGLIPAAIGPNVVAVPVARQGHYLVACRLCTTCPGAYHWFKEEPNGGWTHKPGNEPIRDYDANSVQITANNAPHTNNYDLEAPFEAIRQAKNLPQGYVDAAKDAGFVNYDEFVGYFYCPNAGLTKKTGCECVII